MVPLEFSGKTVMWVASKLSSAAWELVAEAIELNHWQAAVGHGQSVRLSPQLLTPLG